MRILGISAFYHDSAAALVEDGKIVAAAQEERFTRIKHDASFPQNAVHYCLQQATGPVDAVVYYEKPLQKFERILSTAATMAPRGFRMFTAAMPVWLKQKLWVPMVIEEALQREGQDVTGKIHFVSHHESHAASAFFPSPFPSAAVLTVDGVGEWATTTFGRGRGRELQLLRELRFPHSIGLLYSAFTYFAGFRVNSGEYKLMGLAPYGEPKYAKLIFDRLVDVRGDGSFRLNLDYFDYLAGETMTNGRFAELFGGPRREPEAALTQRECDLAKSIQVVTEEILLKMARTLHAETQERCLCLAGGVALNCVANGRLLREGPFEEIWVQPAAGDAGGSVGAALAYHYGVGQAERVVDGVHDAMQGAFLGPEYSADEIATALAERGLAEQAERLPLEQVPERVAQRIAAGAVVGYCQGRAEFGPRALGARSILADARSEQMQQQLNLKIKFRESFRPFAPIVLAERCQEYFELEAPSPYMLVTAPVQAQRRLVAPASGALIDRVKARRSDIPAVTHLDYSARIQTVDRAQNPSMHAVLTAFDRLTGCPVLINTSFNVRGEPPVCHPREALACFLETDIDVLVMGPFCLEKSAIPAQLLPRRDRPRAFALD